MVEDQDLMTTQQVTELLGISMNNLHQVTFRKSITAVKREGRRIWYARPDVEAYKAKRDARKKTV
jgi:predicted site-specific integrase-resolvase